MTQSFSDWQNQIAVDSITGGVLGSGAEAGAISAETAGGPLYARTRSDLLAKLGGDSYLQGLYQKGLTPEQVIYGDAGVQQPTPNERPNSLFAALYNPGLYNDPNKVGYDPRYGVINSSGASGDWLDKAGGYIPAILAAIAGAVTLNPALLGAGFTGGLGSIGSLLFKGGGSALMNAGGNSPPPPAPVARPNSVSPTSQLMNVLQNW